MGKYKLGTGSKNRLIGVHPNLVKVVRRAIEITEQDFSVHDGLRSIATQRQYVAKGVSKTMNSKHLKQSDGFGHAVDLVPYIAGKLRWEWPAIHPIAVAMAKASKELGVPLVWGGVWDRRLDLYQDLDSIKKAVEGYVARRKSLGRSAFIDGPHFQLY